MNITDTPEFFQKLYANSNKGTFYIVGGWVRDKLLNRDIINDCDIATPLLPDEVVTFLKNTFRGANISLDLEGLVFGVVKVKYNHHEFEIVTFREEIYTPGNRKPKVKFIENLYLDLARRDFTVNAMAFDGEEVIDPYGGSHDLENGILAPVGKTWSQTYGEDATRILRASRISALLNLEYAPDDSRGHGYYFHTNHVGVLSTLSPQVLRKNFEKAWDCYCMNYDPNSVDKHMSDMICDYLADDGFLRFIVPFANKSRYPAFISDTTLTSDEAWFKLLWLGIWEKGFTLEQNLTLLKKSMTMMGESKADINKAIELIREQESGNV